MTAVALGCLALAFVVTLGLGKPAIAWLQGQQLGETIREIGLEHHAGKAGTPTMGGLLMLPVVAALALIVTAVSGASWAELWPLLAAMVAFGLLGALDDLAKVRRRQGQGYGFQVRYKFVWHPALSLGLALALFFGLGQRGIDIGPLRGVQLGWVYVLLGAVSIFGASASSLIDGLDGLSGGVYGLCLVAYLIIALHNGQQTLAVFAALCVGALLGFLWFNVHPAQLFMGDTGALAFGGTLGVVAMMSHQPLLLPLIGLVLVVDLMSDVLQVGYFKLTHGKRIFLIAPYHHHLERKGWPEAKIVQRFWLVTAVTASLGVGLVFL
jgi:phospho-N-acetylmuramoyl-pentapeptide-transferase